ncbi:homoserine kinase [Candidatus Bathyarchaeota archaeon]|nr:homoserine kinase [Candidatus Bathyarchaeota archaeon]
MIQAVGEAFCSTANLGAGFDVFGLALGRFCDRVRIRLNRGEKIRITVSGKYSVGIPQYVDRNSAGPPARALLRRAGLRRGLEIFIQKNVPQGLGLGSSGATAAACAKCLDHLLQLDLSNDELVQTASLGERAVTGAAHADNVAASLLGGFVIVYDNPVRAVSIRPPKELKIVVAVPMLPSRKDKTRQARKLVPRKLATSKAVLNIGRASAIVAGFASGDVERIGSGMMDEIAEPYRTKSVPGYAEVKKAALDANAAGVSISGAGPSVVALVDRSQHDPETVANAMTKAFARSKVRSRTFITDPAPPARIVQR